MSGFAHPLALIEDEPSSGERVIVLHGELDIGSTTALREWLGRASESGRRSVAVDVSRVEFLAVAAVYVLCAEQRRMAVHRARLTVVGASSRILQLLEICRLADVLYLRPPSAPPAGAWDAEDEARARRLEAWLERHAAGSSSSSSSSA